MSKLVLVSNRVALPRESNAKSGGLAVVLNASFRGNMLWFGWSGDIRDTPEIHRISGKSKTFVVADVTKEEYDAYYSGFSNNCVYPLLLYRPDLVRFNREDYDGYLRVCERFASILDQEIESDDLIWVHDNQLMSIIRPLRLSQPNIRAGFFFHLPFPPPDIFETLPVASSLLSDWLKYDVIGFQTETDRQNFCAACKKILLVDEIEDNILTFMGQCIEIIVNPVGIKPDRFAAMARREHQSRKASQFGQSLFGRQLILGAERLDYSKGLPERFAAYSKFLEDHPQFRHKVSYLQIAAESRQEVQEYRDLKAKLDRAVGTLNGAFADAGWVPLQYLTRTVARPRLAALMAAAKVGLVTPLRDGFNLVSEEYVAAQDPEDPGVLILSKFAGAADSLQAAITVNPFDVAAVADAIHEALTMTLSERLERWKQLDAAIRLHTADSWLKRFLNCLSTSRRSHRSPVLLPKLVSESSRHSQTFSNA